MDKTWDQTFKDIEVDFDSRLLSTEFWSSEDQIEQYCYSILKYFNADFKSVHVTLNATSAMQTSSGNGKFSIGIPKLSPSSDIQKIKHQVYAKAMVLRHELAHAIFSKLDARERILDAGVLDNIYRYCEDSRIEHLFGTRFHGSINGFHKLIKTACISEESMMRLNMQPFSARNFSYYFRLRAAGMEGIQANDTVKMYEELYQEYASKILHNTDVDVVYALYNEIYKKAKALEPKQSKQSKQKSEPDPIPEESEPNAEADQSEESEPEEGEDEQNNQPSEEGEDEQADQTPDENGESEMPMPSDESEESDEEGTESEDAEGEGTKGEVEESEESKSTDDEGEKSDGDAEADEDAEKDDDADGAPTDNSAEASKSGTSEEPSDEINADDDDEVDDEDPFTDPYEALTDMARTSPDYFDVYDEDIDNMAFTGATMVPLFELWPFLRKNKKFSASEGFKEYGRVVQQNKAVITSVTKFLALKLQHKNKVHNLVYQPEGDLDQDNLKEIIINHNDPRAFHRQIIKKSIGSNVILLIDFSGSMGEHQVRACIVNCIIMMEVCKRLNINYEISAFTSTDRIKVPINASVSAIKTRLRKYGDTITAEVQVEKNGGWLELKNAPNGKISSFSIKANTKHSVYTLKSILEKHAKIHECIMGNMYVRQSIIHQSSTPEFQAVVNVYKRMRHNKNNILFIFNDGAYEPSFIYWMRHNEVNLSLHDFDMNGTNATPATFNRGLKHINKFFDYVKTNNDFRMYIIQNVLNSWTGRSSGATVETIEEAINNVVDGMTSTWKIISNVINDEEAYAKLTEIKSTSFNLEKRVVDGNVASINVDILRGTGTFGTLIGEVSDVLHAKFMEITSYTDVVYKKFIDNMRNEGFRVMGIGINSECGKRYIGEDNFDVVSNLQDIRKNFANKLQNVW